MTQKVCGSRNATPVLYKISVPLIENPDLFHTQNSRDARCVSNNLREVPKNIV